MYNFLNEIPTYNLGNYLQFQMNESIQYDLFESVDATATLKQEWDKTKNTILELAKKGLISFGKSALYNAAGTYKVGQGVVNKSKNDIQNGTKMFKKGAKSFATGTAYTTVDVFKLLNNMTRIIVASIKYLKQEMDNKGVTATIKNLIRKFYKDLIAVIKAHKKIAAGTVLVILIGTGISLGIKYQLNNQESIYNQYKETVELKQAGIVNNQAKGVDLSKYQQNMSDEDWQMIADSCQFVIIKCGAGFQGPRKDPFFAKHYNNARKYGLKVGIYYFFTDHKGVEEQFDLLCETLSSIGGKQALDIKPAIDLENGSLVNNDAKQYQQKVRKFVEMYIEKFKEAPIIYTGAKHLSDYGLEFLYKEFKCPIWVAHYGKDGQSTVYKGKTIDQQWEQFMSTPYDLKDSAVMLQYTESGDGDLTLYDYKGNPSLDIDICNNWNAVKNK